MKRDLMKVLFVRAGIIGDSTVLQATYDKKEDIPSQYVDLYKESNGVFSLTVKGLVPQDNVDRLNEALRKEKNDHKASKQKYKALAGLDLTPEEIVTRLDEYDVLKAGQGSKDGKFTEEEVNARIKAATAPLERDINSLKSERETLNADIANYKKKDEDHQFRQQIAELGQKVGLRTVAQDDAYRFAREVCEINEDGQIVTKEGINGVSPYLTLENLLRDVSTTRPHWFEETNGGGSSGNRGSGSSGNNPWTDAHWNVTEQSKLIATNREQAQLLANSAKKPLISTE